MLRKTFLIFFLLGVLLTEIVHGQFVSNVSKVGITSAPFLEIGVGARATGMGGAFVASANDASALFWNVAGIARLSRLDFIFVHTDWIAGLNFDFVGTTIPLGRVGALGLSLTSLSMDEMDVRTVERPEGTGERFSADDIAMALSYATNLTDRFSIGFTGKYIIQSIWHETASAIALDVGTLFTTQFRGLRIGASLNNFGTEMKMTGKDLLVYHDIDPNKLGNNDRIFANLTTESWPLPLTFQVGLAMEVLDSDKNRLTLATDAVHPMDNTESMHVGFEYSYRELFFLRAGYRNLFLRDSEEGLTIGSGITLRMLGNKSIRFDYSFAEFGRLENIHRFSIGGSW